MAYHEHWWRRCRLRAALCIVIITHAFGCAAKPKAPLAAPDAQVSLSHFTGGPLSGPTTRVADTSQAESAIAASVRLVALEKPLPDDLLKPIDPDVRLIASDRQGDVIAPVMHLTRGVRWTSSGSGAGNDLAQLESKLAAGALGRSVDMASVDIAVPAGATAVLRAIDNQAATSGPSAPRGVELSLHTEPSPADHQLQLALTIHDIAETAGAATKGLGPSAAEQTRQQTRELAVLRSIAVTDSTAIALAIPFRYSDGRTRTILALVQASPGTDSPQVRAALDRCAADLSRSASEASGRPTALALTAAAWPSFEAALSAIDEPASRRAS